MIYDIGSAFSAIEEELIASMIRNMQRHLDWEADEGFEWSMWQAEQLKALERYKRVNKTKFQGVFDDINNSVQTLIEQARELGGMEQEIEILEAIKNGWKPPKMSKNAMDISGEFFKLNTRKLEALITATQNDFKRAEIAMLRRANDQYRQIIFNAQVYANSGAGTYEQAVDMATKAFLSKGINCIEYANGARHTISDYAMMAIRTASKRAYLTGEGEKRQEWGISTVIVHKRGNPCPKCLPFVGKVLIDDVWSGGSSASGQKYPLMSSAIAAGLYHPNCKDTHSTYFEGISEPPDSAFTKKEIEDIEELYRQEEQKKYRQRQFEKYSRLEKYALDEENKEKFKKKAEYFKPDKSKDFEDFKKIYLKANKKTVATSKKINTFGKKNSTHKEVVEITGKRISEHVIQENAVIIDDVKYIVDGKHVISDARDIEKKTAEVLGKAYNTDVIINPRITYPQKISSADYTIDGEKYDLKEIIGNGKDTLRDAVKKKKAQASNFVFEMTGSKMVVEEMERQIKIIFSSKRTNHVKKIVVVKDGKILKEYNK